MNKKLKLYIDIDGVLLTAKNTKPADHAVDFIDFITENYYCYWLTTHCKGDASHAIGYLQPYFGKNTIDKLSAIKSTNWDTLKTEGIDLSSEFFWLDDCPFNSEKAVLAKNNFLDRLIIVDLNRPDELRRVLEILKSSANRKNWWRQIIRPFSWLRTLIGGNKSK